MMTGTAFSLDHTATPPNHAERPAPCRSRGDARFRPWRRARPRSLRPRRRYRPADWCCRPAPATGTDRRVPRTATRCAPRDATSRRRGSKQTEGRGCASRSIPHSGSNTRRGKHDCRLSHHEMPNRSFMAGVLPPRLAGQPIDQRGRPVPVEGAPGHGCSGDRVPIGLVASRAPARPARKHVSVRGVRATLHRLRGLVRREERAARRREPRHVHRGGLPPGPMEHDGQHRRQRLGAGAQEVLVEQCGVGEHTHRHGAVDGGLELQQHRVRVGVQPPNRLPPVRAGSRRAARWTGRRRCAPDCRVTVLMRAPLM